MLTSTIQKNAAITHEAHDEKRLTELERLHLLPGKLLNHAGLTCSSKFACLFEGWFLLVQLPRSTPELSCTPYRGKAVTRHVASIELLLEFRIERQAREATCINNRVRDRSHLLWFKTSWYMQHN